MIRRLSGVFEERRDATLLGLARVAVGALLLWNGARLAQELVRNGHFADYFHLPLIPALVPGKGLYAFLLALKIAGAVAAIVGIAPRAGLFWSAVIGLYLFACDRLQYHNNRYATHLVALLLAFTPCDRSFLLVPRLLRRPKPNALGPFWAVRLTQLQITLFYLVSGGGKLLDPDWRGGQVMRLRFEHGLTQVMDRGVWVPELVRSAASSPAFADAASKLAISTELFVGVGLWFPRTRALALFAGVWFHLGIQASSNVDLFSWLMLSSYVLFVRPELRERTLIAAPDAFLGRALPLFDWLLRFRVEPLDPAATPATARAVDRDGRERRGLDAYAVISRALPMLFPIWLPLAALARARR